MQGISLSSWDQVRQLSISAARQACARPARPLTDGGSQQPIAVAHSQAPVRRQCVTPRRKHTCFTRAVASPRAGELSPRLQLPLQASASKITKPSAGFNKVYLRGNCPEAVFSCQAVPHVVGKRHALHSGALEQPNRVHTPANARRSAQHSFQTRG